MWDSNPASAGWSKATVVSISSAKWTGHFRSILWLSKDFHASPGIEHVERVQGGFWIALTVINLGWYDDKNIFHQHHNQLIPVLYSHYQEREDHHWNIQEILQQASNKISNPFLVINWVIVYTACNGQFYRKLRNNWNIFLSIACYLWSHYFRQQSSCFNVQIPKSS